MHRFFIDSRNIKRNTALITGSDVHHITNVLRLKVGEGIEILDGTGKQYAGKIVSSTKDKIKVQLVSYRSQKSEPQIKVTLAQGISKGDKMDSIIQKCTELGVAKIIPLSTERTVVKLNSRKALRRLERWQRIAKSAAEQSGRLFIPSIGPISELKNILPLREKFDLGLMLWEMEEKKSLKKILKGKKGIRSILLLIGPEGGFSKEEVETVTKADFIPVTLGQRILRTETAPLATLSMILYEFEL